MSIFVNVLGQRIYASSPIDCIADKSYEFVKFEFNLSSDWDGLTVFAQFTQGDKSHDRQLVDNIVCLPAEVEAGSCTLMLYGFSLNEGSGEKSIIGTTNRLSFKVNQSGYISDANTSDMSRSVYQSILDDIMNSVDFSAILEDAVASELSDYLESGKLTNMTISDGSVTGAKLANDSITSEKIVDGSIARADLAPDVTDALARAESAVQPTTLDDVISDLDGTVSLAKTAMQPSVYDTTGKKIDIFNYADGVAASAKDEVNQRIDVVAQSVNASTTGINEDIASVKGEIANARTVGGNSYQALGDAVRGVYAMSKAYTDDAISNYDSFTIEIVDSLPESGAAQTFYLVPKDAGDGYDKYWYITDNDDIGVWDAFGGSSTLVVSELPDEGAPGADYVLSDGSAYTYYKYIDGEWRIVAGSPSYTGDSLPDEADGNEHTNYYIKSESGEYTCYRFIDGKFCVVGGSGYAKDEVDAIISDLSNQMTELESAVNTVDGDVDLIQAQMNEIGNLVSDVTETEGGISIHYKDGTSKPVSTRDTSVTVEDVSRTDTGISIVYTDGDTKEIEISGGGGGAVTSGSASITRITDSSVQCVYGDSCEIEFILSALDSSGDYVGDGVATWYVNSVKKATGTAYNNMTTSFDVSQYLSVGANTVKVSVSVDTGGDNPITVTKSWTVNAINMYVVWDYDDTTINESETAVIRWTPYGDLEKTTHLIIDGVEVSSSTTTRSGVQQYITIDKLSHGSHLAELYITATVNKTEIQSTSIFHDLIFVDSGNYTPVISVPLGECGVTQYNTLPIPVVVYTPGSLTSDVVLAVDGTEVATWDNMDRTVRYWNYTPSESGERVLTIASGGTVKTITVPVSSLDIDNSEVPGYVFRMKASDIASNEALKSFSSNGIGVSFSDNFDWNNGGIQTESDDNGNVRQYICVKAGTTMTINYPLFGDEARSNGKSFKVIFKVTNSRDYDASFLNCLANGIGISLGANEGTVTSEQNTVSAQYAENSYVEFEFDVRKASEFRYLQTYLDGVISSTVVYAADDNFTQTDKQNVVIGSADCDAYIYMVKAYETSLSIDNHIENFISDAPNAQEMVSRYNRNDILLDAGVTGSLTSISYSKLATQAPDSRIHLWDIPRMTDGKKDYVDGCSYQQIYKNGDQRHQISAEGVRISIQGTSSVNYKDSGANTDGNFLSGFTDGNGQHIDTYSMTDDSIGVNYFNTKVNIASCENINNMCLAEWYNRYQPYQTKWRQKNSKARDCMELHMGVQFIKDQSHGLFGDDEYHMYAICNTGNSKKNSAVFHDAENPLECCLETKDNNSNYCLMIPNYGEGGEKIPFDEDQLDSESFFEFRYPESPTSEMKTAFIDFVTWMTESNPALATNKPLSSPVTYGSYTFVGHGNGGTEVLAGTTIDKYAGTYENDTYEYRMAKMLSECEEHLVMDSMVYHYVFVEEHALVDNVCKNTFWGTEDLKHWQLCKNYDNDTADGNDNNGKLIIPFGCEGMDMLTDTRDVFNGKSAVWWTFIYGLYDARRTMWLDREAAGAWDKDAYLAHVESYQDILPERVWNQDYWYKYLRLYEQSSVTTYLDMLEGGKKTHQRESFVTNNMYYMASQYMGTACTGKSITMRGYTPTVWAGVEPKSEVAVMMYNKGYVVVQIGSIYKQVKAEKGEYYTVSFGDSGDMNDTVINIHGANLVQAIGDISCLYVGRTDFSNATRLRSIQIGSSETGYSNPNLTEVSFGANAMLERLYIQNCPNIAQSLDLTGCQALRELDIRGSGFTGVSFALGGLIEKAYLCSPAALNMRSLYNITDEHFSMESYNNLTSLRLEDCAGINSLALVTTATNLARIRILGIDWLLVDTTVLNRMLALMGLDEENYNVDTSVVAGTVYVSGPIRNQELLSYAGAWENLTVTYDSSNLVTQYLATYVNANGDTLCSIYVDRGSRAPDPVSTGVIAKPTMASDAQYDYAWSGWDDLSEMLTPRTIMATYDKAVRTYKVTWYSRQGLALNSVSVEYGTEVVYPGDTPTNTEEEGAYVYNVFAGWDKSTGFIQEDTDVYAIWERAPLPSSGKDISDMSPGEVFAVTTAGKASEYFEAKDRLRITLGHDFDFKNVESELLAEDLYLDGATAIDKQIRLFGDDDHSFTLAIDYQFNSDAQNGTLLSCFEEDGFEGFRLRYSKGPNVQWGDQNLNIGYGQLRDIIVIRHLKGENALHIYASNGSSSGTLFDMDIDYNEVTRTSATNTESIITLGAIRFLSDGGYGDYGTGYIHWCKIWHDDLGDVAARQLASWCHEPIVMECCGCNIYRLADGTSKKANASFVCNHLLGGRGQRMNTSGTNVGGWDGSAMREFFNSRVLSALPTVWQSMVKKVKISASAGDQSEEIIVSSDYVYTPSVREVAGNGDSPYADEGTQYSIFTDNVSRGRFRGIEIPEDSSLFYSSTDPSTVSSNGVKAGDIWRNSGSSNALYIFVSQDYLDRNNITPGYTASGGGGWVQATSWWLRSPYAGNSSNFYCIYITGGTNYYWTSTLAYGVCPCFSI